MMFNKLTFLIISHFIAVFSNEEESHECLASIKQKELKGVEQPDACQNGGSVINQNKPVYNIAHSTQREYNENGASITSSEFCRTNYSFTAPYI